jgi:hypothetical protein
MKRVFLAFAICAIATLSAHAQATFVVTNSANGVEYTSTKRPAGVNTLLTIYGTFTPTSSGAVSMPNCNPADGFDGNDCTGRGLQVRGLDAFGGFLGFGVLSYVSTTQANFFWKSHTNTDLTQNIQFQVYQTNPITGNLELGPISNTNPMTIERRNLQPFLSYTTIGGVAGGYLVGTLYGCASVYSPFTPCSGYVALKSLTDGTANAREYNGWPTLLQVYLTGYNGGNFGPLPQEFPSIKLDNVVGSNSFSCFLSGYGDGNYVGNLFWGTDRFSGPVWGGTGHQLVRMGYSTFGASGLSFSWTQGPADNAGNRPGGLVYFQ